jgi:hypothetical protein
VTEALLFRLESPSQRRREERGREGDALQRDEAETNARANRLWPVRDVEQRRREEGRVVVVVSLLKSGIEC